MHAARPWRPVLTLPPNIDVPFAELLGNTDVDLVLLGVHRTGAARLVSIVHANRGDSRRDGVSSELGDWNRP
jgi:hypothetical protein